MCIDGTNPSRQLAKHFNSIDPCSDRLSPGGTLKTQARTAANVKHSDAGVPTKMTNIDTNVADLDRDQFAALFDEYLDQKSIREQSVVTGRVISIEGDWITVDIGYKAEGDIPRTEFLNEAGEIMISPASFRNSVRGMSPSAL